MKKLPQISFSEWIEAEQTVSKSRVEPRPSDSITAKEYAAATNRSESRARFVLRRLWQSGMAERIKWNNGPGIIYVYRLKSHGKKPIH